MKMNHPIYILPIILMLVLSNGTASLAVQPTNNPLFISCGGLPKSTPATSQLNNSKWTTDEDPSFAPPDINTISSIATATAIGLDPPYDTARLFRSPLTYTFSLSPGSKFLRLYFTTSTSYNNIPPSQFLLSVQANQVILLKNFSPYLNPSDYNTPNIINEFHLTVENHLNLTFSLGDRANNNNNDNSNSYGFINGIEIVPVPKGLYIDLNNSYCYVTNPNIGYTPNNTTALQTIYRLNVGGASVDSVNDSGNMGRNWYKDYKYLNGSFTGTEGAILYPSAPQVNYTKKTPPYVAPAAVYATERVIGDHDKKINLKYNLTWRFEVDPGFDYLMRLHFCEMFRSVTASEERVFLVYIDSQSANQGVDVWKLSGGLGVPVYQDYVIRVDGNGTKLLLFLALQPLERYMADVLLNGLEILKFSETNGSYSYLAAPNPPQGPQGPQVPTTLVDHHSLLIIGGAIGGAILVSLFSLACLVYKRRTNKKEMLETKTITTNTSSKEKWAPISFDIGSTAGTVSLSLPSDLCRYFSLAQIKVATCNFDDNLIIGTGGFGKVYKGSIDGGATTVAIKRLNSTSKQGAREFQTEIEMLSRLRHVHLVPLIGYSEDQGEMILVYEYMPRGALRDHLLYKNPQKNNTPLAWKQRLMICVGSARGLHYLHAGAKQLIIHRDVKSTNILLDDKWTAKVSDFGLSKVGPDPGGSGPTHISTAVKGSAGYLDPEYYQSHQLTEKSDVYSFGVVLFEVLCARAAVNPNLPREQANLAMWARSHYRKETLQTIVDPNLTGQIAPESLRKFGEIADMCVRERGSERPSMGDVVWGLEFALQLQETAENNIIGSGTLDESFDLSSNTFFGLNNIDEFTASRDNFTESSVASKLLLNISRSTTSISSD